MIDYTPVRDFLFAYTANDQVLRAFYASPAVFAFFPVLLVLISLIYLCSGESKGPNRRRRSSAYVSNISRDMFYSSRTTINDGSRGLDMVSAELEKRRQQGDELTLATTGAHERARP